MIDRLKQFVKNKYKYLLIAAIVLTVILLILSFIACKMDLAAFGKTLLFDFLSIAMLTAFIFLIDKVISNKKYLEILFLIFIATSLLSLVTSLVSFLSSAAPPENVASGVPMMVFILLSYYRK